MISAQARRLFSALLLCLAAACSDPCAWLAEKTCAHVGAADPLCGRLEVIAASPAPGDAEACRAGVTFIEELARSR